MKLDYSQLLLSPEDSDLLALRWYIGHDGYVRRNQYIAGKKVTIHLHKVVLERKLGRAIKSPERCDHIHGQLLDCRRSELRLTDMVGNGQNRQRPARGIYRGTTWNRSCKKWQAAVAYKGKRMYLGVYATVEEAAAVAAAKRVELGFLSSREGSR